MEYHSTAGKPLAVIDNIENKQYINSFCVSWKGTWIISVTSGVRGKARVYVRRSEDQGQTWSDRIYAYDAAYEYDANTFDCEMGQLFAVPKPLGPDGTMRIYQFHIVRNINQGVRFGKLIYTYSDDDGKTWLGPNAPQSAFDLESPVYDLIGHNWGWHLMAPPRLMSNGMVYLPMNASTDPTLLDDIRCEVVFARSFNILTETDPAKISFDFKPSPPKGLFVPLDGKPGESSGMEAQIVELSNNRLFSTIRTGNGCIYFTTSDDFGETWNEAKPLRRDDDGDLLFNPHCPCPLTKLTDGKYAVLHCNNDGNFNGANSVFACSQVRFPIYISVGVENDPGKEQPIKWSEPRLMTSLDGFPPSPDDSISNDLTYGLLHQENGNYYHFYNARWRSIQVNRINPFLLTL